MTNGSRAQTKGRLSAIYKLELKKKPCLLKEARELYETPIRNPTQALALIRRLLENEAQEVFLVLHINTANCIIGYTEVARGGVDLCQVDPRIVFSASLLAGASAILLAHNHPSDKVVPSEDDLKLTARIASIAKLLGLTLLDHLVVGRKEFTSIAERNPKLFGTTKGDVQ